MYSNMRMFIVKFLIVLSGFVLLPFLCVASAPLSADEVSRVDRPTVLSSIKPLKLVVDSLAGEWVESEVLMKSHASPHHFALKPSHMMKVREADLLLWVGPRFEQFLSGAVIASKQHLAMSELEGIRWIESGAEGDDDDHHHTDPDLHIWLDLQNIAVLARQLSSQLIALLPEHKVQLQHKLDEFLARLESLHKRSQKQLKNRERGFAVYHAGLNYYVNAYSLNQVVVLVPVSEHKLSVRKAAELKSLITPATRCLLADETERQSAMRYGELFNLPVVTIDLLAQRATAQTFEDYYLDLANAINECLDGV